MVDIDITGKRMRQVMEKLMKAMEVAREEGNRTVTLDANFFGASSEDGRERKVSIVLEPEPFKPVSASLYKEAANKILKSEETLGFVVMDGTTTLFGTLSDRGSTREVLHEFDSNILKKQGRGGQSALDFGRLRSKSHQDYIQRTADLATQFYINPETKQPNVAGLVLAATSPYVAELCRYNMFDPRLRAKTVNAVDVLCGGQKGFNEVIDENEILGFQP